jgi:hypothetical protein
MKNCPDKLVATGPADPFAINVQNVFRKALDDLDQRLRKTGEEDISLNRDNVIAALDCVRDILSTLVPKVLFEPRDDDSFDVVTDHPVAKLLGDLANALSDLDNAKTHPIFKTPEFSKGHSLSASELAFRTEAVTLVRIHQKERKLRSYEDAAKEIAKMSRLAVGRKRGLKAKDLLLWRDNQNRNRRNAKKSLIKQSP